jgi:hypothetical protein
MRTIHKYELDITDVQTIELPFYAEMLTIQEQRDKLVMWCIVDTEDELEPRTFHVVGTGNPIPGQPCYRCEEMVNNEHHLCQDLAWGMAF